MSKFMLVSIVIAGIALHAPQAAYAQGLPANAPGDYLPEDINWQPSPVLPGKVRIGAVVGDQTKPEPFVIRVKVPANTKIMPHTHPQDLVYTIISGVFYIGMGPTFDPQKLKAYPAGSVIVLPANAPHFHWAQSGEYVSQISAVRGPRGLAYVNPTDDPRTQPSDQAK